MGYGYCIPRNVCRSARTEQCETTPTVFCLEEDYDARRRTAAIGNTARKQPPEFCLREVVPPFSESEGFRNHRRCTVTALIGDFYFFEAVALGRRRRYEEERGEQHSQ